MDENRMNCPCCPNHCEAGALQCGKGRAYFSQEENNRSGRTEECGRNDRSRHNGRHHESVSHAEADSRTDLPRSHTQGEGRQSHGGRELGELRRCRGMEAHGRNGEMREHRCRSFGMEEKLQGQLRACGHFLHYNMGEKAGQARILSALLESGTITQRELQDILEVRSGSLSEILNKVEANGFIERSQSENDWRQMEVRLTESGMERASRLEGEREDAAAGLFACLNDEEKKTLSELLDKLLDGWEGQERGRGRGGRGRGRHMHGRSGDEMQ